MKNKTKKLLATLGIGAVLCGGMITTGCSDLEIDQNQADRIMDGSESLLDTINDIDYKQLNGSLQEYLDGLNSNEYVISKTDALGILKGAIVSFRTNYHKELDNAKLVISNGQMEGFLKLYRTSNDKGLLVEEFVGDYTDIYLQEDYSDTIYVSDSEKTKLDGTSFGELLDDYFDNTIFDGINVLNLTIDNIVSVNINENGNYIIELIGNEGDDETDYYFYEFEINVQGIIVGCSFSNNGNIFRNAINISIEYGVLTDSEMQEFVTLVESLPLIEVEEETK